MDVLPHKVKKGLQAFNQSDFYLAYEFFEDAWRETPGQARDFFRALLHLSGGYFRLTQDRAAAARKFFQRSMHWMGQFPNTYLQINTNSLRSHLEKLVSAIDCGHAPETILKHHSLQIQWPGQETSP
jgi:predicted metal-dependent hydrolase